MQKKVKIFLVGFVCVMLASVMLACGGPRYGYGHYRGNDRGYGSYGNYQSYPDSFNIGYREGYEHGVSDRRHGEDFNYSHDSRYRHGISRDDYVNDRFRQGYVRGYESGYYGNRYYR